MTRHGWMLFGLVSVMLLTGCRQMPLRQGADQAGGKVAEPAAKAAKTKKPDDKLESQLSLARLSERHGQHDYAAQVYEAILRKSPRTAEAHHRLGVISSQKQDFDKAERHFQQAMEHGKRSPELLADIGYYFYLREQLDEAEKTLRESLAANPQNKAARNNLALVLGEQGRVVEAMDEFRQVVSEAEAHANMGYILVMLGDIRQARIEFNTALSMDNSLRSAAEALIQLEKQIDSDNAIARDATAQPVLTASTADSGQHVAQSTASPVQSTDLASATDGTRIAGTSRKRESMLIASMYDRPRKPADERDSPLGASPKPVRSDVVVPVTYDQLTPPDSVSAGTLATARPAPSKPASSGKSTPHPSRNVATRQKETAAPAHFQISDSPEPLDAESQVEPNSTADAIEATHADAPQARSARRFSLPWSLPGLSPKK